MTQNGAAAAFHTLYEKSKPRVVYYRKDFLDYVAMLACSALAIRFSYGVWHFMSIVGLVLCACMLSAFVVRHGIEVTVPVFLRKPHEIIYTFVYKIKNLKPIYFMALGMLLLENCLIVRTPHLPHHVQLLRKIALYLFYVHFASITLFRTAILTDHLAKKELVREVLMQTPWKRAINKKTNVTVEIVHAYCTGVLTHIITLAPWYLVIVHAGFSAIFLPVVGLINIVVHRRWYKVVNAWFYRDHWLGHNSEFEFIFLHGTHHDAIPSGMIAVAENGLLEGFMRYSIGVPVAFYNPLISFVMFMLEVAGDIVNHQYIPGVFPKLRKREISVLHHSTHHYGVLAPYSIGIGSPPRADWIDNLKDSEKAFNRIPKEIRNSVRLDEELTGFRLDNPTYRRILSLYDKYQN